MANFCANTTWLIRQAIPPGVSGWGEKEQGGEQKSGSVTVNEIRPAKEAEWRSANK